MFVFHRPTRKGKTVPGADRRAIASSIPGAQKPPQALRHLAKGHHWDITHPHPNPPLAEAVTFSWRQPLLPPGRSLPQQLPPALLG